MSKRTATSDINHENWDREEDPEDAGTFSKAPADVIKTRVIKVAKRRNPISSVRTDESGGSSKPSAFVGFTGFTKTPPPVSTAFGFLSNITNKSSETTTATTITKTNGMAESNNKEVAVTNNKSTDYYARLKGLNESVSNWIQRHVNLNPFINLQPIFKDYENYFDELEELNKNSDSSNSETDQSNTITASSDEKKSTTPSFKFGIPNQSNTTTTTSVALSIISNSSSKPSFSFGSSGNVTSTTTNFSFGNPGCNTKTATAAAKPLSFGNLSTASTISFNDSFSNSNTPSFNFKNVSPGPTSNEETSVDDDEPPKVEFIPVVEEDHVYTIRCKVFVKKEKTFTDRGVGNLYLKSIADSEKYQLIVRADTNLGNLLCNFILSKSIPMQRMGKKDVMLVCLPTPDTKPPPVPILLRVKTSEDADELLKTLQKYKK